MRLLSGLAVGLVAAWTVTQGNPAGAQNFDERFPIIPKANQPDAENQPVPQTEPSGVRKLNPSTPSRRRARKIAQPPETLSAASPQGRRIIHIGQPKQQLTRGRPQSFVNHASSLPSPCP